MYPWPKANAGIHGTVLTVSSVWGDFDDLNNEPVTEGIEPGTVVQMRKDRGIGVACADRLIWITALQMPGKKELDFKSFVNGNSWILKERFK